MEPPPAPDENLRIMERKVFYDPYKTKYWMEGEHGTWISMVETSVRRHLRAAGLRNKVTLDELVSPVDQKLNNIQLEWAIDFAGPLAGYPAGPAEFCGHPVLITSASKQIKPRRGKFPLIAKLLENMFVTPEGDQRPFVLGWLKVAVEALQSGRQRPGQALVFAGPADCGKSLFQNLGTEILGGRAAKPYRYMSGESPFNSELCGAEHLMIEDEVASTDVRKRRHFGARIKDFTVNQLQSCHGKNHPAFSVKPFWRLTISVNDERENLAILPPLDESLADKLMLLKVLKKPMPIRTATAAERERFWKGLVAELPAFIHHLLKWKIPRKLVCHRFGIKHYHHPHLLAAINELAPESRLLALIDAHYWPELSADDRVAIKQPDEIHKRAEEVEADLLDSPFKHEARGLFSWGNAAGTYLARLAKKFPERVSAKRTAKAREWLLRRSLPDDGVTDLLPLQEEKGDKAMGSKAVADSASCRHHSPALPGTGALRENEPSNANN
jgi:hypothetical protein